MINSKSASSYATVLKRKQSGHPIPLPNNSSRPLTNILNFPQRPNNLNSKLKRKFNEYENESFEYDVPTSNYASVRKQQLPAQSSFMKRIKPEQSFVSKTKVSTDNNSLRIVTSTVQGMKHWANKNLTYPILFEVFGKLDSQVISQPSTSTRQFSLIDEKDRIECVFAEIDQLFSNIDRDVQLRIICRLESQSTIARCVAIRIASKDEWNERHSLIQQCDIQLNEDVLNTKKFKKNFNAIQK